MHRKIQKRTTDYSLPQWEANYTQFLNYYFLNKGSPPRYDSISSSSTSSTSKSTRQELESANCSIISTSGSHNSNSAQIEGHTGQITLTTLCESDKVNKQIISSSSVTTTDAGINTNTSATVAIVTNNNNNLEDNLKRPQISKKKTDNDETPKKEKKTKKTRIIKIDRNIDNETLEDYYHCGLELNSKKTKICGFENTLIQDAIWRKMLKNKDFNSNIKEHFSLTQSQAKIKEKEKKIVK